jgi:hypothetical protein
MKFVHRPAHGGYDHRNLTTHEVGERWTGTPVRHMDEAGSRRLGVSPADLYGGAELTTAIGAFLVPPMSINTLAAELVVDRTTLGRNIQPLEHDDLIAIESDPSDGRSKILRLTKARDARFQRAQKCWTEAQKRFERAYGDKQAPQLSVRCPKV